MRLAFLRRQLAPAGIETLGESLPFVLSLTAVDFMEPFLSRRHGVLRLGVGSSLEVWGQWSP